MQKKKKKKKESFKYSTFHCVSRNFLSFESLRILVEVATFWPIVTIYTIVGYAKQVKENIPTFRDFLEFVFQRSSIIIFVLFFFFLEFEGYSKRFRIRSHNRSNIECPLLIARGRTAVGRLMMSFVSARERKRERKREGERDSRKFLMAVTYESLCSVFINYFFFLNLVHPPPRSNYPWNFDYVII